jgi:uncharacterized membrane protein YedE/YeeE
MENLEPRDWLLIGALGIGLLFGIVGRLSDFCVRSAILETADGRVGARLASVLVALSVAVIGTQGLAYAGIVELGESIYLSQTLAWGSLVLGGVVFGIGMVLTRGCGARHLVLAAGGNMRSWLVLLALGLTAYATLRGLLALPRMWIENVTSLAVEAGDQSIATLLAGGTGQTSVATAALVAALTIVTIVVVRRAARKVSIGWPVAAGIAIGLLIPASWYVTGVLSFDEFEPVRLESLTFTAPVGNAIQYLLTLTGSQADFGIVVVAGVLLGAFAAAAGSRTLRADSFEGSGHLGRYLLGGALMGFGGVLALGCTIGAGLSGLSTLSFGSLLASTGIVSGAVLCHRLLNRVAVDTSAVATVGSQGSINATPAPLSS